MYKYKYLTSTLCLCQQFVIVEAFLLYYQCNQTTQRWHIHSTMNKFDKQCKTIRLVNFADIHSDCQNFIKQRSKINSISIEHQISVYQFVRKSILIYKRWPFVTIEELIWKVNLKSYYNKQSQNKLDVRLISN